MEERASQASPPRNAVDRAIEAIAKLLSYSFALSIVVTIYDVISDVIFRAPTVWVYDVVTTAIARELGLFPAPRRHRYISRRTN